MSVIIEEKINKKIFFAAKIISLPLGAILGVLVSSYLMRFFNVNKSYTIFYTIGSAAICTLLAFLSVKPFVTLTTRGVRFLKRVVPQYGRNEKIGIIFGLIVGVMLTMLVSLVVRYFYNNVLVDMLVYAIGGAILVLGSCVFWKSYFKTIDLEKVEIVLDRDSLGFILTSSALSDIRLLELIDNYWLDGQLVVFRGTIEKVIAMLDDESSSEKAAIGIKNYDALKANPLLVELEISGDEVSILSQYKKINKYKILTYSLRDIHGLENCKVVCLDTLKNHID